jgi:hypothetical protein
MSWLEHLGNEFAQAAIPIVTGRSTLQGRFDGLGTRAMTNADIAFQSHLCDVPSTVWAPCLSNDANAVAAFAIDTTADECHLMLIDLACEGRFVRQYSATANRRIADDQSFSYHFSFPC